MPSVAWILPKLDHGGVRWTVSSATPQVVVLAGFLLKEIPNGINLTF
jgi:hypothetical protein